MSGPHIGLLIAALAAASVSLDLRRAWLWIGALALSFIASVVYLYLPKPYVFGGWWPPASGIAAICDMFVCTAIYVWQKRQWETWLYYLVLFSVLVNVLYTTGQIFGWPPIPSHEAYAIGLEVINYAALLLIGGTAIVSRVGANHHGRNFASRALAGLYMAREALRKEHRPSEALRRRQ